MYVNHYFYLTIIVIIIIHLVQGHWTHILQGTILGTSYHLDKLYSQRALQICIITSMCKVSVSALDMVIFNHPHAKINSLVHAGPSLNFFHLLLSIYPSMTSEGLQCSSRINLCRGHHYTLMHEVALEGRRRFHQMALKNDLRLKSYVLCKISLYASPPEKQCYPKAVGKAAGILSHTPMSGLVIW